ncbi:MAG: tyrosine-type recombinase/integrase [Chlamydiae bacterium]|nr:tyrosine-type recombinase/integrase [Chlamydiota bacterium]
MSPEHHIQRYLEETKQNIQNESIFGMKRNALRHYLAFLNKEGQTSLDVSSDLIHRFRESMYFNLNYSTSAIWTYTKALREFYEHLKSHNIINENPVKVCILKKTPVRERHYTDEEIIRAYLISVRPYMNRLSIEKEVSYSWKRIKTILKRHDWTLKNLDRAHLETIAKELDRYPGQHGLLLNYPTRIRTFNMLRELLRWMKRNGHRNLDPGRAFRYHFSPTSHERVIEKPPVFVLWQDHLLRYMRECRINLRPTTTRTREYHLRTFFEFLTEQNIQDIQEITTEALESYRTLIYENIHWAESTKYAKTGTARYFIDYLERTNQILINPARKIIWPYRHDGLPTRLMTQQDVKTLLGAFGPSSATSLRNRTIFEVMYSSGLRASEAGGIRLEDINFQEGLLKVQNPKGGKSFQRVVPIGKMALEWIQRYLKEGRTHFIALPSNEQYLFLSSTGKPITSHTINGIMLQAEVKRGLRRHYSSHSWRVTCATEMLKNHADIRHVQEQLGHRSLNSTQIYTRLMPMDLKKVHQKTHPREKEYRRLYKGEEEKNITTSAPIVV